MKKPNTNILLRLLDSLIASYNSEIHLEKEIENNVFDLVECIEFIHGKIISEIITDEPNKILAIKIIKLKIQGANLIFEKTFFPGDMIPVYTPEETLKDKIRDLKTDLTVLTRQYNCLNENSIEDKEDKALEIIETVNYLELYEKTNIKHIKGITGADWETIYEIIESHENEYLGDIETVKRKL